MIPELRLKVIESGSEVSTHNNPKKKTNICNRHRFMTASSPTQARTQQGVALNHAWHKSVTHNYA